MKLTISVLMGLSLSTAALAQAAQKQGGTDLDHTEIGTISCPDKSGPTCSAGGGKSISSAPDLTRRDKIVPSPVRDMFGMSDIGMGGIGGSGSR